MQKKKWDNDVKTLWPLLLTDWISSSLTQGQQAKLVEFFRELQPSEVWNTNR